MPGTKERTTCRACLGSDLTTFLDLGDMPLANGFLTSEQVQQYRRWVTDPHPPHWESDEPKYPLQLRHCARCGMVQLGHVVDPGLMFNPEYAFKTSSSARMVEHFARLFDEHPARYVVEIGGNDNSAWDLAGCDSAYTNVDPSSPDYAFNIREPFTEACANRMARELDKPDLIVACNVLGHIDDLDDVMRGVKALLHPEGKFIVEVPYLGNLEIGQVYHEHLSYFSRLSLGRLVWRHGMYVEQFENMPVHGGSIRAIIRADENTSAFCSVADSPLFDPQAFARRVTDHRFDLMHKLARLKEEGKSVVGYCASAKGTMILNYGKIDRELLSMVIDDTPTKIDKYVPGTHQQIAPSSYVCGGVTLKSFDAVVILSPNHADEIKAKHPDFHGEWIIP